MKLLLLGALLSLSACSSLIPQDLPAKRPPLADMEEPLALTQEPKDEAERSNLPLGGFTGIYVTDARKTLDELEGDAAGVRVSRIVENSPGDAAGIEEGDILTQVTLGDGPVRELSYPSQWRAVELAAQPGAVLSVVLDRAGAQRKSQVHAVARVHPTDRQEIVRLREEVKVGVVLRSATEVEARAAGLGPGGGAVVVGLSGGSPWRAAGVEFGDLLVSIDGNEVAHPQAVLDAIRGAEAGDRVSLEFVRGGKRRTIDAPLTRRASELSQFSIPVVFDYESSRGDTEWSLLLGLASYESTIAAWRLRLLWLIQLGGGDADKLVEVK